MVVAVEGVVEGCGSVVEGCGSVGCVSSNCPGTAYTVVTGSATIEHTVGVVYKIT